MGEKLIIILRRFEWEKIRLSKRSRFGGEGQLFVYRRGDKKKIKLGNGFEKSIE
jgi:hypothetical protein